MAQFLESEKIHQIQFKNSSSFISEAAKGAGVYKNSLREFCLPLEHAEENLFPGIQASAPLFFITHGIKWHDGANGKPSNHLCDSQVCGVNFLFPFADQPEMLAQLLRPFFPELKKMLPIESGQYVSFEWIGAENYLGELITRNEKRTRGANFTSADAAVFFERKDQKKQIVLIEWKYTESYGSTNKTIAASGTDRRKIYQRLFDRQDCPIDKSELPSFDALFYEPFYQFMRQQLLANEMEKAHELGADFVSLLHIAPEHNTCFQKVTSPQLKVFGDSVIKVWKKLVPSNDRFLSLTTEKLFGPMIVDPPTVMRTWAEYLAKRYRWVIEK
jgi:hypothetical protein